MIISIDGNSIGKMIEKYILAEKLSELEDFSRSISDYLIRIKGIIERYAGKVYMCGGDNILSCIDDDKSNVIIDEIIKLKPPSSSSFSIGCGDTASLAFLALAQRKSCPASHVSVTFCKIENNEIVFQEKYRESKANMSDRTC